MHASATATRPTQAERVESACQALLDAAAELVIEQGYHATTAAQIAERAGYSREMVRVRFGSKLDLMRELLVREFQGAFQDSFDPSTSALEHIRDAVERFSGLGWAAPTRLRAALVLGFEAATSIRELRNDFVPWLEVIEAQYAMLLKRAVAEGSIRAVDCDEYARLFVAASIGGGLQFVSSATATDPAAPPSRFESSSHRVRELDGRSRDSRNPPCRGPR